MKLKASYTNIFLIEFISAWNRHKVLILNTLIWFCFMLFILLIYYLLQEQTFIKKRTTNGNENRFWPLFRQNAQKKGY